jgi:hypothetical protein
MADIFADVFEPVGAIVTADALSPTVDALEPTADGGILVGATESLDALVNANFIFAELVEPVRTAVTADSLSPTVDSLQPTADGGLLDGASDQFDAEVISFILPVSGWRDLIGRKRVVGRGFGVLPELEGAAYGVVGVTGDGSAMPSLSGEAVGTVDDDLELLLMLLLAA